MITHAVSTGLILAICIMGMFTPIEIGYRDGAMLVLGDGLPAFQLNGVVVGWDGWHEYGHYLQQKERGDLVYYATVALPSFVSSFFEGHYYTPWEYEASVKGYLHTKENSRAN